MLVVVCKSSRSVHPSLQRDAESVSYSLNRGSPIHGTSAAAGERRRGSRIHGPWTAADRPPATDILIEHSEKLSTRGAHMSGIGARPEFLLRLPHATRRTGARRPQPPSHRPDCDQGTALPVPGAQRLVHRVRRPTTLEPGEVRPCTSSGVTSCCTAASDGAAARRRRLLRAPRCPPRRGRAGRGRLHPLPVPRLAVRRRHRAVRRDPLRRHASASRAKAQVRAYPTSSATR